MHNQDWLVDHLRRDGVVKHHAVEQALRQCDRKNYVDADIPHAYIYQDAPLPIGYHETISAPHMHATCLELLREHLRPGARVLDVGSGSGYLAAAMGVMVGDEGKVIGVEKHAELAQLSIVNVRRDHPELLDKGVVELRAGNVLGDALEGEEPFDAIHVGAAASSLPDVLVRKLKPGGRMVIPVGRQWEYQVMQCIDKDPEGDVHKRDLMGVRYVPLTEPGDTSWEE
jgi:protein-L-isoaspartate(D-aspartate) O-methyltransferase